MLFMMAFIITSSIGCTEPENNKDWTFDRKIEIVCPWGAGGGADTTVREFATILEKKINQKVVVNNVSGAGGVRVFNLLLMQIQMVTHGCCVHFHLCVHKA